MLDMIKIENDEIVISENIVQQIKFFEEERARMELKKELLKKELLEAMKKYNISSWQTNDGIIKAVYRGPSKRVTFNTKDFKKEFPDLYDEYSKESDVKESLALTINIE